MLSYFRISTFPLYFVQELGRGGQGRDRCSLQLKAEGKDAPCPSFVENGNTRQIF